MANRIRAFFSYRWRDAFDVVSRVYDRLHDEPNFYIWRDVREAYAGPHLDAQIANGIDQSQFFVCFITKNYYAGTRENNKCLQEFEYASEREKKLVFVMMENLDMDALPSTIRFRAVASLRINGFNSTIDSICDQIRGALYERNRPVIHDYNALHQAILQANTDSAITMIRNRMINLDAQDPDGRTALIIALQLNLLPIAEELIRNNANIGIRDKTGCAALDYAVRFNFTSIIQSISNRNR